ncbi:MAG: hypothetical protein IID36_12370 [Planctomycetes bacterium]|nr:hypothetical protein [Planctomycetota bacterium]
MSAELIAALVAVVCYVNVLSNEYTDDGLQVATLNPLVTAPGRWVDIWTTDYWFELKDVNPNRDLLYRPVALTSFRLVRAIAGGDPFPQLLVNVLIHALVAAMTVRLCRRLGGSKTASLAAGVCFAVLPIHVEVIANVVGRADMLAAIGLIGAALCHRRSMFASGGRLALGWRTLAAFCAFAAMGAKESGVGAVAAVCLLDAYWFSGSPDSNARPRWFSLRTCARLSYLILPVLAYFALRYHALGGELYQRPAVSKTVNVLVDAPTWQHALGVVQLWGMYWIKSAWPMVLSVNYSINSIRLATSPLEVEVLVGILVTVGLVVGSIAAWRRGARGAAFAALLIVVCYAPTANALMLIQVFFAERIWYLPSVGVAVLAGMAVGWAVQRRVWCAAAVLVGLAMAGRCWIRNVEWHDNGVLYASAYRDHPDAIGARLLYGDWLVSNGNVNEGIELLIGAMEIDAGFTDAHRSLGRAYLLAGRHTDALHHLQIANMQIPGHARTVRALAEARKAVFQTLSAELDRLIEIADAAPDDVAAEIAVIQILRDELGRGEDVLARLGDREAHFAGHVAWQYEYAVSLQVFGRPDEAILRYRTCLELDEGNGKLLVELAGLLMNRARGDDLETAWDLAARAAELAPDAPNVLICQAELLALRGDLAEAVKVYRRAARAFEPGSKVRRTLDERIRALGG